MRYLKRTSYNKLRKKYDIIAGWGQGIDEFEKRYMPHLYKLDYAINGESKNIGEYVCGCKISGPDCLLDKKEKKICFIIYTNLENIIVENILELYPDADTIVCRLVDYPGNNLFFDGMSNTYSTSAEDLIFLDLLNLLGCTKEVTYMDIGVCHPIIRNNTYLLYESGYSNGILIEPNVVMANYSKDYRPKNKTLNIGACSGKDDKLTYVSRIDRTYQGWNHFLREGEIVDYSTHITTEVPVQNINRILEENCNECPVLIDLDIEGQEIDILKSLDTERFPVKIFCVEMNNIKELKELMKQKGYVYYVRTLENLIFVRLDDYEKIKCKR